MVIRINTETILTVIIYRLDLIRIFVLYDYIQGSFIFHFRTWGKMGRSLIIHNYLLMKLENPIYRT